MPVLCARAIRLAFASCDVGPAQHRAVAGCPVEAAAVGVEHLGAEQPEAPGEDLLLVEPLQDRVHHDPRAAAVRVPGVRLLVHVRHVVGRHRVVDEQGAGLLLQRLLDLSLEVPEPRGGDVEVGLRVLANYQHPRVRVDGVDGSCHPQQVPDGDARRQALRQLFPAEALEL
eukprot:CAMPEP_0179314890 /NCGR_PEP_ID=MMETSP0797-20121207/54745_1 /TAXON_ID=47934 /ORGANISM="Dinophysis acuminata, Strain DAEP01" /LENGTH=170 /DNA_ID=CAMNT_0021025329 /DNA_START=51 /DNA_END=563 /DNA_ORIENTATION=+